MDHAHDADDEFANDVDVDAHVVINCVTCMPVIGVHNDLDHGGDDEVIKIDNQNVTIIFIIDILIFPEFVFI